MGAPERLTKAQIVEEIAKETGATKAAAREILAALAQLAAREVRKGHLFVVPGLVRLKVVKKPARKAREGVNPFTKEPMTFAAKPASRVIKATPVADLKAALG